MNNIFFRFTIIIMALVSCQRNDVINSRIVKPFDFELVFKLPNEKLDIYSNRILLSNQGLFVVNSFDQQISLIDISSNNVLRNFGDAEGKGPGQHEFVMGLMADSINLYTIDPKLLRLSIFDIKSGALMRTIPTSNQGYRAFGLGDKYYAVNSAFTDSLIYLHNAITDSILSSTSILDLDLTRTFALSAPGRYLSYESRILYFPVWDHRVFEFIVEGNQLHRGRVYPSPLDTVTFKPSIDLSAGENTVIKAPNSDYSRSSVTQSDGKIFTLVHLFGAHPTQRYESFIDIYDSNLNYLFSYGDFYERIYPDGIQEITVHDDTLCYLSTTNVRCYKIQVPESY